MYGAVLDQLEQRHKHWNQDVGMGGGGGGPGREADWPHVGSALGSR